MTMESLRGILLLCCLIGLMIPIFEALPTDTPITETTSETINFATTVTNVLSEDATNSSFIPDKSTAKSVETIENTGTTDKITGESGVTRVATTLPPGVTVEDAGATTDKTTGDSGVTRVATILPPGVTVEDAGATTDKTPGDSGVTRVATILPPGVTVEDAGATIDKTTGESDNLYIELKNKLFRISSRIIIIFELSEENPTKEMIVEFKQKFMDSIIKNLRKLINTNSTTRTKREIRGFKKVRGDVEMGDIAEMLHEKLTVEEVENVLNMKDEDIKEIFKSAAITNGAKPENVHFDEPKPTEDPNNKLNEVSIAMIVTTCVLFVACIVIGIACYICTKKFAVRKYYYHDSLRMAELNKPSYRSNPIPDEEMTKGERSGFYAVNGRGDPRTPTDGWVVPIDHPRSEFTRL